MLDTFYEQGMTAMAKAMRALIAECAARLKIHPQRIKVRLSEGNIA